MRKSVTPKLRFEVFERDRFRCRYCGLGSDKTVLEIDHITPRSKGGKNIIDNLVTSCHACNRGKGAKEMGSGISIKTRIDQSIQEIKSFFYDRWNAKLMGNIDKKTYTLFYIMIKDRTSLRSIQSQGFHSPIGSSLTYKKDPKRFYDEVANGGELFERCLGLISHEIELEIDSFIDDVFDDENWDRKCAEDYSSKLNYMLTEELVGYIEKPLLYKFSLHLSLLEND